jgi:hypothetical protein
MIGEVSFKDCKVELDERMVTVKLKDKGIMIPLSSSYISYSSSTGRGKFRLRDFDVIYGGDSEGLKRDFDFLRISLKLSDGGTYVVILLDDGQRVYVVHGYSTWDGDKFGFMIGVVERWSSTM